MFQENSIETCILSRVKQITSPGWMNETSTQTWCTGKTQRERVEREVGGGIGMGNTCKPMAISFQCMTKFTTNKKINKLKKKKRTQWIFFTCPLFMPSEWGDLSIVAMCPFHHEAKQGQTNSLRMAGQEDRKMARLCAQTSARKTNPQIRYVHTITTVV